jgi:hypothetical protein
VPHQTSGGGDFPSRWLGRGGGLHGSAYGRAYLGQHLVGIGHGLAEPHRLVKGEEALQNDGQIVDASFKTPCERGSPEI